MALGTVILNCSTARALWTFTIADGVEPTNNHAERGLRGAVIYRKLSLGSQSDHGERTTERLVSASVTCRLQRRSQLAPQQRHRVESTAPSNAIAECLYWLLILNRRHLERVLRVYVDHYNRRRAHRALDLRPPDPDHPTLRLASSARPGDVMRRDRLDGLSHEYSLAA